MATGGGPTKSAWHLHCRKCSQRIVPCSYLTLTLVGPSGIHVQLKQSDEAIVENSLEKIHNPKINERGRTPFKVKKI